MNSFLDIKIILQCHLSIKREKNITMAQSETAGYLPFAFLTFVLYEPDEEFDPQ